MIASAIGGHVPNSYTVVTLFGVDGLLLIIVDGSWSSRCLNYRIDVPDKIGSISSVPPPPWQSKMELIKTFEVFFSSIFHHHGGGGAT